jgi:hypothetical protein
MRRATVAFMQPLPHVYSVTGRAAAAGQMILSTPGAPALASAAPALAKAEHGCLVGNSLRCQLELQVELALTAAPTAG